MNQKRRTESSTRTLEPVEAGAKAEAEARSERAATVFIGTVRIRFLNKQRVGTFLLRETGGHRHRKKNRVGPG